MMSFGVLWFSVPVPQQSPTYFRYLLVGPSLLHLAVFQHKRQLVSLSCTPWVSWRAETHLEDFLWSLRPFELIYRLVSHWEVWLSSLERNWTDNKHCWNTGGAGCQGISLEDSCKLSLNESQQARYLLTHGHYLSKPGQQNRGENKVSASKMS